VVAIFSGQMLEDGNPIINGSGDQQRDFVHVSDVAKANVLALDRGDNEILNIGSGVGTSVNRIYSLLAELTGFGKEAIHGPAKKGEVQRIFLNSERARSILGWRPEVSLREGLALTVDFFRSESSTNGCRPAEKRKN
jgi:UDP-glucose 4-epimerase